MKNKIHYVPLEDMEQRYTKLMNKIIASKSDYVYYPNDFEEKKIYKGEFLDIERTIEFKSKQIAMISTAFQNGLVKSGDIFFIADIFFPGIESIKYIAELQDIDVKIVAFNHAGRADKTDFVQKLNKWADVAESNYHAVADMIFVGSEFHKKQVLEYFKIDESKVIPTGCVWDINEAFNIYPYLDNKEDYVIYPHRLCKEKGYDEFIDICNLYPNYQFLITSSGNKVENLNLPNNVEYIYGLTKKDYYQYMSRAKYFLSTAYQETFGYTIQEALLYNCVIAAPNRACYPEVVESFALYDNIQEIEKIFTSMKRHDYSSYKTKYTNNITKMWEQILC